MPGRLLRVAVMRMGGIRRGGAYTLRPLSPDPCFRSRGSKTDQKSIWTERLV